MMTTTALRGACLYCGEDTIGPIMTAGLTRFHPECFRCSRCQICIGDDEQYILVDFSTLYCGNCWVGQSCHEKQHVIKVVKIPPVTRDGSQYKLRKGWIDSNFDEYVPQVFEILHCGPESQLIVGDRILEINGTSIHGISLTDVEKILNHRSTTVQVTVEQTPSPILPTRRLEDSKCFGSLSSLDLRKSDLWGSCAEMETSKDRLSNNEDVGRSRKPRRSRGGCEERAASLSRLSDCSPTPPSYSKTGLARTLSFREQARTQCTFRACDLVKGELLGKGFFGQVFKVTHSETNEVMVLKDLYRLDEEAQKNFLKEVAVLRRLEHPNVLRFIGVLYKERKLHLITEYVRGGSLRELIQNFQEPLSWKLRTQFAHDISCGMAYLHSMGVIHRDLSSHNCLVREDKSVVVADFGLARITSEMSNQDRFHASKRGRRIERKKRYTVVGNPFWMAPEMMKGNKYDEKVDIFSFGIVLCELIGRVHADPDFLPRSGDFSLNQKTFLEKFCDGCPEPLYRIAFMCCDLNPDKRPSFEVLAAWLESVSSSLTRGLPFPKELVDEIQNFGFSIPRSPPTSECTSPESSFSCSSTSSSSYGSGSSTSCSANNLPFVECPMSSTCSSLSTFTKPGRLHSIVEVDHSSNNNSMYSTPMSSPSPTEMDQPMLNCSSIQNRTLSASPSS